MSSLHTILEHEEPDESLELVSGVQRKHQTISTLKRLHAHKRLKTGPTAQDPTNMSPSDPTDRPVLHTILEHEEPDEFLDLISGVQRKYQTSSTLRRLQVPKRRKTGPTAQDPTSMSPSDPADHPVQHTSKVGFQSSTLVFILQHTYHSFNTALRFPG